MTPRFLAVLHASAVAALAGCGPSPQPLPPPEDVGIDIFAITATTTPEGNVLLEGGDGALTGTDRLEVSSVGGDPMMPAITFESFDVSGGTFSIEIDADPAAAFRLQAFGAAGQTDPVDVMAPGGGAVSEATRIDCVVTTPSQRELVLDPVPATTDAFEDIVIDNQCTEVIGFDALNFFDVNGWQADTDGPLPPEDLLPGAQRTVTVRFGPDQPGLRTNIMVLLFIGMTDTEQRMVTLRGEGT